MASLQDSINSFKKSMLAQSGTGFRRTAIGATTTAPTVKNEAAHPASPKKKRKKATITASEEKGLGQHVWSQVYSIISHLKSVDDPQTIEALKKSTGVDVAANPQLYKLLTNNPKIDFDEATRTFAYKPTFNIKSTDDLLALLEERKDLGGMEVKDLLDSYKGLSAAVDELEAAGRLLVVRNKDRAPRILFYNDPYYNTNVDEEFKTLWHNLKIPDQFDLGMELEKAGLKTMEVFEQRIKSEDEPKKKKSRSRNRKVKITNTHLENIDLTKDYPVKK
ncbi:uncharacterized protein VTP21DRAFT_5591 [Calcarisporiella thermophila]|uniref:uncharacterized protein n=1 Tax=Calcarisporiella thermophila TaxID=911321 RepID=UPI003743A443